MFKKILLLISIMLFSIKAFSIDNTPSQVVKEFYTAYVEKFQDEDSQDDEKYIGDTAYSKSATPEIFKYVTKDLANKLKIVSLYSTYDAPTKLYEYNTEGGDYFLQTKYFTSFISKTLKIGKETIKGSYAKVVINYYWSPNELVKILVTLKKEDGKWKIIKVKRLNI